MSGVIFFVAKSKFLPRQQINKMFRWDYDFVEIGEDRMTGKGYALAGTEYGPADADEWSVGSSSSVSPDSRSPVDETHSWEGETLASHSDTEAQR